MDAAVNCPNCGATNPDDAVFCGECSAPMEGDAPEPEAPAPVGHPHAQLPKRCPSCGGPVYPDDARCSRCGTSVLALAALEQEVRLVDADGHDLWDVDRRALSGPRFRDLVPRVYWPVCDDVVFIIDIIILSICAIGVFLVVRSLDLPVYVVIVSIIGIILGIIAAVLSIIGLILRLLPGNRRLYGVVDPMVRIIVFIAAVIVLLLALILEQLIRE